MRLPVDFAVGALLERYAATVGARGGELPGEYAFASSVAARIAAAVGSVESRPCHDDLLAANIIRAADEDRLMIVDWEYAGMGDPRFDLGNLAVNNDFDEADERRLLAAYHGAEAGDAQRAELKLMRVLSDAREAAWGVVQGVLSELEFDFDGYCATSRQSRARRRASAGDAQANDLGVMLRSLPAPSRRLYQVRASAEDGRLLAREAATIEPGAKAVEVRLPMPSELRNRAARIEIEGDQSAGSCCWSTSAGAAARSASSRRRMPAGSRCSARITTSSAP